MQDALHVHLQHTCINFTNFVFPCRLLPTAVNCGSREFECNNGLCVARSGRCDGDNDCGDNSDEEGCSMWTCMHMYMFLGAFLVMT